MVLFVPPLQVDAVLGVAGDFDEAEHVAVMLDGRFQFEHADRDVPGAQYAGECHSISPLRVDLCASSPETRDRAIDL